MHITRNRLAAAAVVASNPRLRKRLARIAALADYIGGDCRLCWDAGFPHVIYWGTPMYNYEVALALAALGGDDSEHFTMCENDECNESAALVVYPVDALSAGSDLCMDCAEAALDSGEYETGD